jgi:spermidine/putrescine transport system substrate-binding protein
MIMKLAIAGLLATTVMATAPAQAETLRLLTWGSYAPTSW